MLRAPGMTMFRMPIFTWNMLVDERHGAAGVPGADLGARHAVRRPAPRRPHLRGRRRAATPVLWQHLFWFFGHPEVYIIALPFFGVVTEILPVFSRRPVFGYKGLDLRHARDRRPVRRCVGPPHVRHRRRAAAVLQRAVAADRGADRREVLQLDRHDVARASCGSDADALRRRLPRRVPARRPDRRAPGHGAGRLQRHRHVLRRRPHALRDVRGGWCSPGFGAIYYWFPKFTGRMLDERLGKIHFWLLFIGFNMTFLVQHQLGLEGMPRRVVTYRASDGFGGLNMISTIGSFIIARRACSSSSGTSWRSLRHGRARRQRPVGRPDARVGDHLAAPRAQLRLAAPDPLGAAVLRPEVRRPRRRVAGRHEGRVVLLSRRHRVLRRDRHDLLVHELRGRRHDDAGGQLAPRAPRRRVPAAAVAEVPAPSRGPPRRDPRRGRGPGRPVPGVDGLAVRVRRSARRCSPPGSCSGSGSSSAAPSCSSSGSSA